MDQTPNRGYDIPDMPDSFYLQLRGTLLQIDTDVDGVSGGGMANPMTTLGDIIRGATSGAPQRLAVGTEAQVLTVVSGEPEWADPGGTFQPLDSDLTAIAALATATYGRSLLTLANATALAAEVDSFFLTPVEGNAAYQPLDGDLTSIAGLTPSNDDIIQRKSGVWTNRTVAQYKADLALTNVTNDAQTKAVVVPNTLPSSAQILVGNAGGTAYAPVTVSGDVTITNAGVTAIGALKVTNAMIANNAIDVTAKLTGILPAAHFPALSGDVSNSAGSLVTAIGALKVTNAMLAGSIAASKLVGTDIATVGTITAGTWQATVIGSTYGGTGINNAGRTLTINTNSGTLAFGAASKTLTINNSIALTGTDGTVMTFPSASATIARTDAGQTFTGNQTFAGHVTPSLTDTYDLGSSTLLWRKGWLSELDAVLFAQNTVSVIGGWLLIAKGEGTVDEDIDTSETQIDFGTNNIAANDFIIFRAAGAVEYMQATSVVAGNVWNVTRNLDGSGANAWPQGSVYVNLGYNGPGRIELNANSTPRISMIKQGTTYNSQTELLRIGDLNGWSASYSSELYGVGIGDPVGSNITVEATNGVRLTTTGGNITLGSSGLTLNANTDASIVDSKSIRWLHSGDLVATMWQTYGTSSVGVFETRTKTTDTGTASFAQTQITAYNDDIFGATIRVTSYGSGWTALPTLPNSSEVVIEGSSGGGHIFRGLRVGGTGGPGAMLEVFGSVYADGTATFTGDVLVSGLLKAGSTPTTLTSSAGKILSAAFDTAGTPQFAKIGFGAAADATALLLLHGAAPKLHLNDTTASSGVKTTMGSTAGFAGWGQNRDFVSGVIGDSAKAAADYYMFVSASDSHHVWRTASAVNTTPSERMKLTSVGILDLSATTGALLLNRLTTTQRDALTAVNGMLIYNSTTAKFQGRAAGAWVDLH